MDDSEIGLAWTQILSYPMENCSCFTVLTRPEREVTHPSPSSVQAKNAWSSPLKPPYGGAQLSEGTYLFLMSEILVLYACSSHVCHDNVKSVRLATQNAWCHNTHDHNMNSHCLRNP
jgi:hypothetical protein